MTQEDKALLYKDLCARLPYGVVLDSPNPVDDMWDEAISIDASTKTVTLLYNERVFNIDEVKPYLFPLSSMTEEQEREYNTLRDFVYTHHYEYEDIVEDMGLYDNWRSIDYLNANHFDYRGLIEKGLAIDATGLNIY